MRFSCCCAAAELRPPGSTENRIRQNEKIQKVLVTCMASLPAYGLAAAIPALDTRLSEHRLNEKTLPIWRRTARRSHPDRAGDCRGDPIVHQPMISTLPSFSR